ncbi:MAG: histidine phosphatase family protein [Clostridia bacterium]
MKLYLVRHGKTQANIEFRYLGSTDQELAPAGRAELETKLTTMPQAQRVYVSPMRRARESAELLFPQQIAKVIPGLEECAFGAFEMRTYEDLKNDAAYRSWIESKGKSEIPQGESGMAFRQRTVQAFKLILAEMQADDIEVAAIVAHGGTIMTIMEAYTADYEFFRYKIGNGEYLSLDIPRQKETE